MNPLDPLDRFPHASVQLLLLLVFVASYVAAVSACHRARGRVHAGAVATLAAIALCIAFQPWTVGVMLAAACVVGVGMFIVLAWVIHRLLARSGPSARTAIAVEPAAARSGGTPKACAAPRHGELAADSTLG